MCLRSSAFACCLPRISLSGVNKGGMALEPTKAELESGPTMTWPGGLRFLGCALVLALVISTFMPPLLWHPNENDYLVLAYRRFAPEMFSPNSAIFDSSNSRFLGLYLMGAVVGLFGYETGHLVLRILMALAYGLSLAYLLSVLRLTLA